MKVPAITMLMVVLTTEALPSALIWAPMARSGENQPTATVEEGLTDPKAAEVTIEQAFLEEEKAFHAAVLEAIGKITHAQVQTRLGGHVERKGRSVESGDRKSTDIENRFFRKFMCNTVGLCGRSIGSEDREATDIEDRQRRDKEHGAA